ncbi:hypothetical protein ccbrp13_15290 [Ktedonobacteria bacterium brp13]|nr:hypothetical protein ccbrp13_15290 [Ktedonobacteria bacterium brp13]
MENPQLVASVDTHVWRVSKRLGLIGPKVNADMAHTVFAKLRRPIGSTACTSV